jgi:hypothetical protein
VYLQRHATRLGDGVDSIVDNLRWDVQLDDLGQVHRPQRRQ